MTTQNITTDVELWKPVVGYEGLYDVSSYGRVRSLDRVVTHSRCGDTRLRGQIMNLTENRTGYLRVRLCEDGVARTLRVHRLVLTAFVGEPFKGAVCLHLDNNRQNNHVSNLRWGTSSENNMQMRKEGRGSRGETCGRTKLTEKQVLEIRRLYAAGGVLQRELGLLFNVSSQAISHIISGRTWRHI